VTPEKRSKLMLAATLAMFAAIAFLAWDGDRRAFLGADAVTVKRDADGLIFAWRGEVRAPMAQRFAEAFDAHRDEAGRIVIELSSPGGSLAEGHAVIDVIGAMKRTHEVDTRVRARDICLSMCVPIFLQGEDRIAAPSSHFMFHQPTAVDFFTEEKVERPAFERRMDAERFYNRYLIASGVNPVWGETLKAEWDGKDVWKTGKELFEEDAGIVTVLE